MVEQAADALRQQHTARHTRRGLHGPTEEAAGATACRRGAKTGLLRWRLGEARRRRLAPATARGHRGCCGTLRLHSRGRITPTRTKDAGQETTTIARRAVAVTRPRSLGLGTGLLEFGFQLLVLLVEALDCGLLHQDRLGHVIRRRRLLTHMFLDARLGLRITRLARVLGLLDAAKQAVDQGLFFSVHGRPHGVAGHRTASKMGRAGTGFNHWRRETFFSK
ncbi:hypothetical protein D3C81_1456210 [compost metagenome]